VGVGLGIGEVVDRHDLHVAVETELLVDRAVGEAADAAEAVDSDADGHGRSPEDGLEGTG